jgi:glycosyltransferase involved in cell wall biosynthesis
MSPPQPVRRVLMTTDCVGGVFSYTVTLAQALAASGLAIDVVTLGPRPSPAQRASLAAIDAVRVVETDLMLEWQDPQGLDIDRARSELAALAARLGPDVVHLNGFREACFDWPAPVVVVAHSSVDSWALACRREADFDTAAWRSYGAAVAAALDDADAWVAPTVAFRNLVRRCHRPARDGMVIHNGAALPAAVAARREPVVLAAGRLWDPAKDIGSLGEAARALPWPVDVAGPADEVARSDRTALRMLGALDHADLQSRMARAAIFVAPALYEPFGLAVLEAAGHGCALVLSDIDSFRELWDGAAIFVPAGDSAALARSLRELIADPARRTGLQQAARRRAASYGVAPMATAYRRLYDALAACRGNNSRAALDRRPAELHA